MDALTQLIESYVSRGAGPMTDALAAEGFKRALRSLPWAFRDPSDGEAREDMSIAAYLSGVCLANAGLGAVHGLAAAAGGSFHVPHGLFCGVLLPHLLETNINFLRRSGGESLDALSRFDELGAMAGGGTGKADALVGAIRGLVAEFNFPGLSKYGISREHAAGIAAAGLRANSMRNNPAALTPSELEEALLKSL
jgi:alcohol dehydrogenase class IV